MGLPHRGGRPIEFADSKNHPQLQVADWAAGATRQWAQWMAGGSGDQFSRDLEPVARPWLIDGTWPAPVDSSET